MTIFVHLRARVLLPVVALAFFAATAQAAAKAAFDKVWARADYQPVPAQY